MELLNIIEPEQIRIYLLVLVRISLVLFMFPLFSSSVFPSILKAGFAMVISLLLYSVVEVDLARFPMTLVGTGLLALAEAMIGLTLGLCLRIFFGSVQLAGQVIGFQMGFAMMNVVDPMTGANVSIMDQIGYWVVLILFLVMNGHHIMIVSLIESFSLVPIGYFMFQKVMLTKMLALTSDLFVLALKLGAPVIAVLLLTSGGFGLVAKFSPQTNVMIVAMPIKVLVGLFFFGFVLQIIILMTREYISGFKELLMTFLFWAGGGG
ncbi:MAG: flagellar biosynthetic protein FliR [Desulfobacteraceae bacterium]